MQKSITSSLVSRKTSIVWHKDVHRVSIYEGTFLIFFCSVKMGYFVERFNEAYNLRKGNKVALEDLTNSSKN